MTDDSPWDDVRPTKALPGRQTALIKQLRLRVIAGPDRDRAFSSLGERTVIGTHDSVDFKLADPSVSRFHCEIAIADKRAVIKDLDSTNGTRVNGLSVLAANLEGGETIAIGQTQLRFEIGGDSVHVELSERERFGRMVGRSVAARRMFAILERAAKSDVTVLLQGETGTGKDLAAESLHRESARANGPFVVVDCGAIPGGLLESELFGHEKGAFTGADRTHTGAFEAAGGGTLFLDEIGELSLDLQPKLLRVLESREIRRIGGARRIPVDVRLIAATNRDLTREVNAKTFRSDLYYRLAVLAVNIPPLRDRTEDLPLLVETILDRLGTGDAERAALRTPELAANVARHRWPGNIRELRNYIERCVALQDAAPAAPASTLDQPAPPGTGPPAALIDTSEPLKAARTRWLRQFETTYLEQILKQHGGNVSAAARAAGVDRIHFYRLLSRNRLR